MNGFANLALAIKDLIMAIWEKGNQKLRTLMLIFFGYLAGWFLIVFFFAAISEEAVKTAVVVFTLFFLGIPIFMLLVPAPILGLAFLSIDQLATFRKLLLRILLTQALVGAYLAVVPIQVAPVNFLLLVCLAIAISLMSLTVENKRHIGYRWGMRVLVIGALLITYLFLKQGGVLQKIDTGFFSSGTKSVTDTVKKTFGPAAEVTIRKDDGNTFLIHLNEGDHFTVVTTGTFRFYDTDTGEYSNPFLPGRHKQKVTAGGDFYVAVEKGEANIKVYLP